MATPRQTYWQCERVERMVRAVLITWSVVAYRLPRQSSLSCPRCGAICCLQPSASQGASASSSSFLSSSLELGTMAAASNST